VAETHRLKKIMLIGSGPIIIGQACEFDYSGTRRARPSGRRDYEVVLVKQHPATIMTDTGLRRPTYIEPITRRSSGKSSSGSGPTRCCPPSGGRRAEHSPSPCTNGILRSTA